MLTGDQWMDLKAQTFMRIRSFIVLKQVDPTFPNVRELLIQANKLDRMLDDYGKRKGGKLVTGWDILAGRVSVKKNKRVQGEKTAAIHEQLEKVKSMAAAASKEWLRRTNPKMTNAEFRGWLTSFDTGLENAAKEIIRQIKTRETPQIPRTTPFSRLGSTKK